MRNVAGSMTRVAIPGVPASARAERLLFEGGLLDLVAVGLHRPALDAILGGEPPGGSPIDRDYLRKILEEEIARPFSHPLRPLVELFLNAADASPPGAAVDIALDPAHAEVSDTGAGMDLRTLLSRLLVPFATDKLAGHHLGRFGVGFFSVLGLAHEDPGLFALDLVTGDGVSGLRLRVTARSANADGLDVALSTTTPRSGTRVRVRSATLEPGRARSYLREALHFFPPERAVARLSGIPINDGSAVSGGELFHDDAGLPSPARFHLGGHAVASGVTAGLYHLGVRLTPCHALSDLVLADFPGEVELTEGRDALKPGPAFTKVAAALHRRLASTGGGPRIAELAGQVSALMLQGAAWGTSAAMLAEALLGSERCLVGAERAELLRGFFGGSIEARLFVCESFWAEREWQGQLPGERELLSSELYCEPIETLALLAARRPDLAGLEVLCEAAADPSTLLVALTTGRHREPGPLPCLEVRGAVLIRGDARAIRAPAGWADSYALRASFRRALGLREPEVERDLIVLTPLTTSAPLETTPPPALEDEGPSTDASAKTGAAA